MKKILIALLLVGCGTQTPEEKMTEDYTNSFVEDCMDVYGEMCTQVKLETAVIKEDYPEIQPANACWTEDGTNKRGLGLTLELIKSNNRTEIYKEMLACTVFATDNVVNFEEFAERLELR